MAAKNRTVKKKTTKKAVANERTMNMKSNDADVPSLFRLNVEEAIWTRQRSFTVSCLAWRDESRRVRCYFTCGPVTLQVVDVSAVGKPHPAAKALYFTVAKDLDAVFARAKELGCLSRDDVHGVSGGGISVRPWVTIILCGG